MTSCSCEELASCCILLLMETKADLISCDPLFSNMILVFGEMDLTASARVFGDSASIQGMSCGCGNVTGAKNW